MKPVTTIFADPVGGVREWKGTSGVTATMIDRTGDRGESRIEYAFHDEAEGIALLKEILHMFSEKIPGTVENALYNFFDEKGWLVEINGKKYAHIKYKKMEPSITCPKCGMTSYHPMDIEKKYCGNCHQFHDEMDRQ